MGLAVAAATAVWLLGVGFWVQGFRCLPSTALDSFLKDGLSMSPATQHLLGYAMTLPVLGKPVYGVLTDAVYIGSSHRMPHLAIGVLFQAISWLLIATLPASSLTFFTLSFLLLLASLGVSITEVINDAIATEYSRSQPPCRLESLILLVDSLGGLLASSLLITTSQLSPNTTFHLFTLILTLHFFLSISIPEPSLNLPKRQSTPPSSSIVRRQFTPRSQFIVSGATIDSEDRSCFSRIIVQLDDLMSALNRPEIFYSICWFSASYAAVPFMTGTMFDHLTIPLELDVKVIGLSKVFGHMYVVIWSAFYRKWLKGVPPRRVLSALQGTAVVLVVSDVFFVKGMYRDMGVSDDVYVVVFYGLLQGLIQCKELPFSVLIGNLCPVGCEGGLMGSVALGRVLGSMVGGYFGVAVVKLVGGRGEDFVGVDMVAFGRIVCALVPLCMSLWIHEEEKKKKKIA